MEKRTFYIMGFCFTLYKKEVIGKKQMGIFKSVARIEDILEKYQRVKYFLRKIEYAIVVESQYEFFTRVLEWGVTVEFLSFVIMRECINKEKIVSKLERLCVSSFGRENL